MNAPKPGGAVCQCPTCKEFFTTTNTFDQHRAWTNDAGELWSGNGGRPAGYEQRICRDPSAVGLHQRSNGAWGGQPMTAEQKAARGWGAPAQQIHDHENGATR